MLLKRLGVSRCAVEEGWRWVGWLLEMIGGKPKGCCRQSVLNRRENLFKVVGGARVVAGWTEVRARFRRSC